MVCILYFYVFYILDMYMIYEFHNTINARVSKVLWCNVRSKPKSDAQVGRSDETQNCGLFLDFFMVER